MLCYCDKCGSITDWFRPEEESCYCCDNSPLKPIPRKYIDNFRWRDGDGKQAFIEEVVKTSPNLDQYLFEHKDKIIQTKNDDMKTKMAVGKAYHEEQSRRVTCSYCGSTNVKKITMASKAVHTALFGIWAMGQNSKNYYCNNCGSKF